VVLRAAHNLDSQLVVRSRSKGMSNKYPSYTRNEHIQTISWPAETPEMNLASVVKITTTDWRQDIQEMVLVPVITTYALVEQLLSGLPPWSASEYVVKSCKELGPGC
jgi:hypothetical protein